MRIADKMAYDQINSSISKNRSSMAELQNQAATQKRVTKPSDDPVAASRVLSSRVELRGNEQYIKNLNYAKSFLDFSEQSLSELTEVLVRAKELALSQANDAGASAQTRRVVSEEIKQLRNQAIQIANRKLGERFIFGGFKTTKTPFDSEGNYSGDQGEMKIHIDKNSFLSMNMPGSIIFQGKGLSPEGFSYKSLEQPHTVAELEKQKAQNPDSFSDYQNEKLNENKNVIPGEGENQNSNELRGPASIRVSEEAAPVYEESENESSRDGVNVLDAIKKLQISLSTDDKTGVQESIDRLDDALQQVIVARTSLGSRVTTIDNTLNSLYASGVDTKANISQLEDADAFEVISDINKTESALQATLQTSGKLVQKSLMDFIS